MSENSVAINMGFTNFVPPANQSSNRKKPVSKSVVQTKLNQVFRDTTLVNTILQNKPIPHMRHTFPSIIMEKKTNASGKGISYEIQENNMVLKSGRAVYIGRGSFGDIYADNTTNMVYKVITYKIPRIENTRDTLQYYENVMHEVAIQAILHDLTYTNHDGKEVPMAPEIYGIYRHHTGSLRELTFVIEMEKAGVTADNASVMNRFRHTLQDYAIILNTLLNTYNIKYNHCDTKLNNLIFDKNNCLQLLDFGFSSIKVVFDDKSVLHIAHPDCGWNRMGVTNMGQNIEYPGYYIEKDVIQLVLSTRALYYGEMDATNKKFLDDLLHDFGFTDYDKNMVALNTMNMYNMRRIPNQDKLFHNSYNHTNKIRRFVKRNTKKSVGKMTPGVLSERLQEMNYPPEYIRRRANSGNITFIRNAPPRKPQGWLTWLGLGGSRKSYKGKTKKLRK